MLSIKAICKSKNNEEVIIIGFELEGYCLCMTKSGTIFHAKHEDLTIVDKEYIESCAKGSIDFEMADFLEKASARLDQTQSKQLTSIILELQEYRSKIERGTLVDTETYFIVEENQLAGKNRFLVCQNAVQLAVCDFCESREEAEKKLKELQG